jgi:hypothetical protein
MGSLFGGSNDKAAKAAQRAADEAAAREAKRQADIKKAVANINNVFNAKETMTGYKPGDPLAAGSPLNAGAYYNAGGELYKVPKADPTQEFFSKFGPSFGSSPYDLELFNRWAGLDPNNHMWSPTSGGDAPGWYSQADGRNQTNWFTGGQATPAAGEWVLDEKKYMDAMLQQMAASGQLRGATPQYSGGFGDSFYNAKAQSYLDYYMPQLQDQYDKSKEQLTYGLANAGLLRSSAANKENADLFKQGQYQEIGLRQQSQAEAAKLRQQVANEKSALISQALASADPDLASNQAAAAAKNLQAPNNDYDPLGEVFKNAIIGGGNYYQGYQQGNMAAKYPIPSAYGSGSGRVY